LSPPPQPSPGRAAGGLRLRARIPSPRRLLPRGAGARAAPLVFFPADFYSLAHRGEATEAEKSTVQAVGYRVGAAVPSAPNWKPSTPHYIARRGYVKMVRRTNRSSAGKLSGSNYTAMQAWFFAADTLAEQLTELFNRIAASQVPAPIVPLLTAGRGAAIPKPGGAGLRPVAVGSILMRFVGTLALIKKSAEISVFSLGPRPLKFAVGLAVAASSWRRPSPPSSTRIKAWSTLRSMPRILSTCFVTPPEETDHGTRLGGRGPGGVPEDI